MKWLPRNKSAFDPDWIFLCFSFAIVLILLLCCTRNAVAGSDTGSQAIAPENVHVLAIGCCAPWAESRGCAKGVDTFVRAVVDHLGVPRSHVLTVVDEAATYQGVTDAFARLSRRVGPESSCIIYYQGHGVLLHTDGSSGAPEEVFVLWSKKFPFAGLYAVLANIWMKDQDFARLVDGLPGRGALVVADTCHASDAWAGLKTRGTAIDYGLRSAALMAAAQAGERAVTSPSGGLFTRELAAAMSGKADNLLQAFFTARRKTLEKTRSLHRQDASRAIQTPSLEDPTGIVPRFVIRPQKPDARRQ